MLATGFLIRAMIRKDMQTVLEIEGKSFDDPWTDPDFINYLRRRNCMGMVIEVDGALAGYVIYELNPQTVEILNLAVHPDYRRRGAGRALVAKMKSKLSAQRRSRLVVVTRERNLDGQLFFRSVGLRATGIVKQYWKNSTDEGIRFLWRYRPQ